jgi:YHS domain-containing protein
MKKVIAIAVLMMGVAGVPAYAVDEHNVTRGLTAAGAPLGLHGIDPVAFLDIGNRVEGDAKYTSVHNGVAYYFSSKENKKMFEKNENKYIPQNGGFCTYGVSVGKKFDGDPQYADVVDGKLYVFLNKEIFKAYQKAPVKTINTAAKQWKEIKHSAAESL